MAFNRRRQLVKQPYEVVPLDISFGYYSDAEHLPVGATELTVVTASAVKWHRQDPQNKSVATSEILESATGSILNPNKTRGRIQIKGGTSNYDYQITVKLEFDNGAKLEKEYLVRVRED